MLGYHLTFGAPVYLLLLAGLPALWWFSMRSLVGLGRGRRLVALAARSAVIVLLVLALADTKLVRSSDRLSVIYLLDQSASIPDDQRRAMADYVNAEVKRHRLSERQDRAGVIVFGRDAALEVPPIAGEMRISAQMEARVANDHTDIAAALKLAMAAFPNDSARRVVIVTDGNENLESALDVARGMAEAGVGIDIAPVRYPARSDVAVERISIPPDVARGQPFDVPVLLNNSAAAGAADGGIARGNLEIFRKAGDTEKLLARQHVELPPGKRVFNFREEIEAPDFYVYEARYVPDDPARDAVAADNRATTFTHVRGQGQVLVIENRENKGAFDPLVTALRNQNLQVVVQPSDQLFTSLAELQPFDAVVLADVPRENFSAAQIKMLARNMEQMGAGLIMLGGPNSFGAGGWAGTEVEEAMPVEFQIKNAKLRPAGALALVIDRSGSMSGEKLALAKAAAIASLDVLAEGDYATVVAFDAASHLVAPLSKKSEADAIRGAIERISADGGTNMYPAILAAAHELAKAENAPVRHMILLTDGMSEGSGYPELVEKLRKEMGMTVSTVGVGPDADEKLLQAMARSGGGRYYAAKSPQALPRIFQEEARVVARPLVFEHQPAFRPEILYPHAMLKGIDSLPAISGYVLDDSIR